MITPAKPNPKAIGERSEAIILAHLLRRGAVVLLPFGNNQRYDLVVDLGGGLFKRGQCKTALHRKGRVEFWSCSSSGARRQRHHYRGQADVFWVYCSDLDKVYEVPVDAVGAAKVHLRTAPTSNGITKNLRWARDYEI